MNFYWNQERKKNLKPIDANIHTNTFSHHQPDRRWRRWQKAATRSPTNMCGSVYEYRHTPTTQTLQWRMTRTRTGESEDTGNPPKSTERQLWFVRTKNILDTHWPRMPAIWVDADQNVFNSLQLTGQLCPLSETFPYMPSILSLAEDQTSRQLAHHI